MLVYAATKNLGKFRELHAMFARSGIDLSLWDGYEDVAEGETSYVENAALKARALRAAFVRSGMTATVLGDDSGLEVAALDGRPGVLSARYGGTGTTWAQRRQALLEEVAATNSTDRRASFVCALSLILEDGRSLEVERTLAGSLATAERGRGGFSYDPLFIYPPLGMTFAEMDEAEKNRISHRALAVEALLDELRRSESAPESDAPAVKTGRNGT